MPISALTAAQQHILAATINSYVTIQLQQGNDLVYNQIRTATASQIQNALGSLLNAQLAVAQSFAAALPAKQALDTAAASQAITDLQAVIAQLA